LAQRYTVLYDMRHELSDIRHSPETIQRQLKMKEVRAEDFVLEKDIFNNIFEKDIRRVFIYKKAEQLAKAIHLITPAFSGSLSLKNRIENISIDLIDAAVLPLGSVRTTFSRELLALSSILSIARANDLLSPMNAEIITREAHLLLKEIAAYEEPRLLLEDVPTLSGIAKNVLKQDSPQAQSFMIRKQTGLSRERLSDKGHIKDRRETLLAILKDKRKASIKDISTLVRNVSEKTIQRELSALIEEGTVLKQGERRWSVYSLA